MKKFYCWSPGLLRSLCASVGGITQAVCLGLILTLQPSRADNSSPLRKIIFDQDSFGPATSNLQSILMVIQSPVTQLLGITVVSGDGWRDENVAHALRLLEVIGRTDIPVVPGSTYPLVNSQQATKRWEALYGKLVYKGAWMEQWPGSTVTRPQYHAASVVPPLAEGDPSAKPDSRIAANFLIEKAHQFPGEITIIAAGPLTNIALATRLDPEFPFLIKEIVIMGGSLSPQAVKDNQFALEYLYTPRLEFNFRWDPDAAKIVLHSPWKRLTLVPVDPTTATEFTPEIIAAASTGNADAALGSYLKKYAQAGFPMWDELSAAIWLDPSLITKKSEMALDVDNSFTASYGNTLSWAPNKGPGLGEQNGTVIQSVDVARLNALFIDLMRRPTPSP